MSVKQFISVAAIAVVTGLGASIASAQVTIPTVPIGNVGNAPDPLTGNLYGSVAYAYNIGTTEVTNAQYIEFLNNVAFEDPNGLYNSNMGGPSGGITRAGNIGAFFYTAVPGRANHPVNFVSFWNAARFANWLHNGQPTGFQDNTTTEDGAYTLTPGGISANTVTRNAGWQWAVTSENEWYKAAFHQPAVQGGDSDSYWLYPTSSNTAPTAGLPPAGRANYNNTIANTMPVGSYAPNYYGTFDMGGNLWEWTDTIINGFDRGLRGESYFGFGDLGLRADGLGTSPPTFALAPNGFRVVGNPPALSTTLQLLDTVASFAAPRQITYTVIKNNANIASGVIAQNASSINASISLPPGQTGAATVVFDGSSFLRRAVAIYLTGSDQSLGQVNLTNGDADLSGEVDAADIDLVIADFGSTSVGNSDVDVSGEVDAADIDIVIANFGSVDE